MARHSFNISSEIAVLPRRNDVEMGPQTRYTNNLRIIDDVELQNLDEWFDVKRIALSLSLPKLKAIIYRKQTKVPIPHLNLTSIDRILRKYYR